jgi:hypothetical protein
MNNPMSRLHPMDIRCVMNRACTSRACYVQIHTDHADLDNLLADDEDYDDSENDNDVDVHADGNSVVTSADMHGLRDFDL